MILAIKALYSQRWTVIRNLNLEDVIVKENTNETKNYNKCGHSKIFNFEQNI